MLHDSQIKAIDNLCSEFKRSIVRHDSFITENDKHRSVKVFQLLPVIDKWLVFQFPPIRDSQNSNFCEVLNENVWSFARQDIGQQLKVAQWDVLLYSWIFCNLNLEHIADLLVRDYFKRTVMWPLSLKSMIWFSDEAPVSLLLRERQTSNFYASFFVL